eukprot:1684961-Prorocentrum_lima.AAC.1
MLAPCPLQAPVWSAVVARSMVLCIVGWRFCPSGWGPWVRWRMRARMAASAWLVPQALPEAVAMCPAA